MILGFIGTGEITKSVVLGILGSNIKFNKIYLSKRNSKISQYLSKKNKKIFILKNNQEIINKSNWVFLGITPRIPSLVNLSKAVVESHMSVNISQTTAFCS